MNDTSTPSLLLSRFAKVVVACTLFLIFRGALVSSWDAGMAVPDWPLSFGTLNPEGWWGNHAIRLEHGHRLVAMVVGLLITFLTAAVWANWRPLLWAFCSAVALVMGARVLGVDRVILTHLGIWSFALGFAVFLLVSKLRPGAHVRTVRWLAVAAFIGVSLQASFGGLRVVLNNMQPDVALVFRIVHACVAQLELAILVVLAAMLSPFWSAPAPSSGRLIIPRSLRVLGWCTVAAIFLQLMFGATMRHFQAGLAIPTFPAASYTGSWLPAQHTFPVEINFAHTRIGAVLVSVLVLLFTWRLLALQAHDPRLRNPAWLLLMLLILQVAMGIFVIWHWKPPTLTSFHVLNGAVVLAVAVLATIRLYRPTLHVGPAVAAAADSASLSASAAPAR